MTVPNPLAAAVGVLFQAVEPPVIDGIRKPMKPGGYSDSGADIAHELRRRGRNVVTPVPDPDPADQSAWVFPDTADGIAEARSLGAEVLWANTVVFRGHPLDAVVGQGPGVVGQLPDAVHRFDDKWHTNDLLRRHGLPVAAAVLVARAAADGVHVVDDLTVETLADHGVGFPAVVKPVRGRGSQGVTKVDDLDRLREVAHDLLGATTEVDGQHYPTYGDTLIVEEYLDGSEVTVTVMPPGTYAFADGTRDLDTHWSLPPVERSGHVDGITPYNGVVAVTANSRAVTDRSEAHRTLEAQCAEAAALVEARAPIRIDCRGRATDDFQLFDLNMKPNMTGAGRPGRDDQDSLSCMAARVVGWSYGDLLDNMLRQAWYA